LTGENVEVILTGKRTEVEKVMAWFNEPALAEGDVTQTRTLSDIKNALPKGEFLDDATNPEVYEICACCEGCSIDLWRWVIYKIHKIAPNLKINSTAHWQHTVTGGNFISRIDFVDGVLDVDKLLQEEVDEEDFEYEVDDHDILITAYVGKKISMCIPDKVTYIFDEVFDSADYITEINVSEGNKEYASHDGALFDKKKQLLIRYPIKKQGCYILPDGVKEISEYAFDYCNGLTKVAIPDSLTVFDNNVFSRCKGLTDITVNDTNTKLSDVYGVLFNKYKTSLLIYPCGKTEDSYIIPESVTKIESWAFLRCTNLMRITIPDSVTKIGMGAFNGCASLTDITIPDSVIEIAGHTFCGCTRLTSITIPDSVTKIGMGAFYGCTGLTDITIPDGVTVIGDGAFNGCTGLTDITIPDGVTVICDNAFAGCTGLTDITIPDGVTEVGKRAFYGCTGLTDITIPDGVTKISGSAFRFCASLTNITIPDGVIWIGDLDFYDCASLTSITIPDSITEIGYYAFSGCASLTSITIPDSITEIGRYAFFRCASLTSIIIPDSITEIDSCTFSGCASLTNITIPDGVTVIGNHAFDGCTSLTIHAPKGSYAEKYAIENKISFSILQ